MTPEPRLSLAERDRRWSRSRALMAEQGLDAIVVFGLRGRERYEGYLSNEAIEGAVILPFASDPVYITWTHHRITRRFAPNMGDVDFWIEDVRVGLVGPATAEVLAERGLGRGRIGVVGLETKAPGEMEGIIPYKTWSALLDRLPQAQLEDVSVRFSLMMLSKSDEELALLRHAAAIGERACQAMLDVTRPGVSERDIYAVIMNEMHRAGAVSVPPNLIVSVGSEDVGWAPPYWNYAGSGARVVQEGDLVQAEIFPCFGGVETQMQMSIAIEPVSRVVCELHEVVRQAYECGLEAARPGLGFQELAELMAGPIREAGLWTLTPLVHSTTPVALVGKIGINIERAEIMASYPGVRTIPGLNDMILEPGVPLAFEPNACSGSTRVNIGGTVLVGHDQPEELNQIATTMHVVEP